MSFTKVTVVGLWQQADGSPCTGTVTFRPSAAMQQAADLIVAAASVTATLDSTGHISVELDAVDDPTTLPTGVVYDVIERIHRARREYAIVIPHTATIIDLSSVAPAIPGPIVFGYALQSALNAEVTARSAGDASTLSAAESFATGAVGTETARAMTAEAAKAATTYVDAQDAATLAAADSHAESGDSAHAASSTAHPAAHVTVAAGAGVTSTDVQAALGEITGMIQSQEAGDSAAVAAVAAGLADETTRASAAEAANATAIATESTARSTGDTTNATAITNETTRASAAEAANATAIAAETTRATAAEATKQAHDADLDTIAALDSSTAGALVTDGGGWIRKTYSQLKTALGLVKGDVGLGNVDNTSDVNKPVSTAQAAADAATLSSAQTFATGAVGTETSRAMTAEATKLVAGSTATYANLAALPAASAHTNEIHKTLDGGVYESTGSAWVQLVAPTGTYASSGVTDGVIADPTALDFVRNDRALITEDAKSAYADIFSPCPALLTGYWDDSDISNNTIMPLHRDRMIPFGMATVPGWIDSPPVAGTKISWSDLAAIRDMGMEIVCHSQTHSDPNDHTGYATAWAKLLDEVNTALASLQTHNFNCDAWKQPGTYTGDYYLDSATKEDQRPVRLFRSKFTLANAYDLRDQQSYTRPWPQMFPFGGGAVLTIENTTLATLQTALDNCIKFGGLLVISGHSRNLDQPGNLTTADWTSFLDYVNTKRLAGSVECLTPTAARFARFGPRRNLLQDPLFDESATGAYAPAWQLTGAPIISDGGPNGLKYVTIDGTHEMWQFQRSDNLRTVKFQGYARAVSGTATARVVLRNIDLVGGSIYVDRSITATVGTTWTLVEGMATMDARGNALRVWLHYNGSGSAVQWADLRLVRS